VRQAARQRKKEKFTALMHLVDVELLRQSYFWLQRKAAAGVDGMTWQRYGEGLEDRLVQLHGRIPIATPTGRRRPGATTSPKNPQRSQHQALDALAAGITRTRVSWIVDADIRSFFDNVSHEWLTKFLEHRIGDPRIIRLIGKWLKAGALEEGTLVASEEGTPQGAVISPLLANIYLHYVFDLWAHHNGASAMPGAT
jgi:hypothetical protein